MELKDIGFDSWFQSKQEELQRPDCSAARVTAVNRDSYLVSNGNSEVPAELTGKLVFSAGSGTDYPCVGDWVLVQYYNSDTFAVIHGLFPRKSFLRRKTPGRKIDYQAIAANIDVALIVQSCDVDFNLRRLERYLVMINEGKIEPVLLLTKSDLVGPEELDQRISAVRRANINCRVIAFSNTTGSGLDEVRQLLEPGRSYCLLGSSRVGKTSLLNNLLGRDLFETNIVRAKDGRGKHTTTSRQLIVIDNGAMLIDTPGMRELGNIGDGAGIEETFIDIQELSRDCRFVDCTHITEPGCAVLAAIGEGKLSEERYRSYLKLIKESEYNEMSYLERREKDRQFGQFIKTAKKQLKKR